MVFKQPASYYSGLSQVITINLCSYVLVNCGIYSPSTFPASISRLNIFHGVKKQPILESLALTPCITP